MSKENNNMGIWSSVEMSDPKFIKKDTSNKKGAKLSSIDGYYIIKKATEVFGPIGKGWGYEITKDVFIDTAPMIINNENIGSGKVHTLGIMFWYMDGGEKFQFEEFGHTDYMYAAGQAGSKYVMVDKEYAKKSLTDAIKKSLSLLGFCSDVFLGMFEDSDYVNMVINKVQAEKAEDVEAARKENESKLLTWVKAQCAIYAKIPSTQACDLSLAKHLDQVTTKCRVLNFNPEKLLGMLKLAHKERVEAINNGDKK